MTRNGRPSLNAEHNRLSNKHVFHESGFIAGTTAHIWHASVADVAASIMDYYAVLSDTEKVRADRFHSLEDRRDYVLRRAVRRLILAEYVGCDPREVEFGTYQHGKPFLLGSNGSIRFNVTYTKHVVLVGVTNGTELGIDVEFINREFDWLPVARKFFPEHQLKDLRSRTGDAARTLFFSLWTQTEAILKARGVGLSGIKEALEFDGTTAKDFRIIPFELQGSCHGSLAVAHAIYQVDFYRYADVFTR
ncbi:4'-phosphopantetheinyl transferase family protein [Alicyclobacillus sp. ALC3]|uniref:4'-phosphopantetheinyl transferase family protein n=1 Tax=Alicyclobacillus sp. ALC3 TaxID=2796143 RepID=UPI00237870E4|nr:4'-phosphopantetheinyl transferase superfamily protein [Alicyclobacillus sp. ALC3]WDL95263.1 4'-phosphopantetheinyl transferase superfamily protein [Alicyclobacillus sp. ALC3]